MNSPVYREAKKETPGAAVFLNGRARREKEETLESITL
jgi:hypothetical protein